MIQSREDMHPQNWNYAFKLKIDIKNKLGHRGWHQESFLKIWAQSEQKSIKQSFEKKELNAPYTLYCNYLYLFKVGNSTDTVYSHYKKKKRKKEKKKKKKEKRKREKKKTKGEGDDIGGNLHY